MLEQAQRTGNEMGCAWRLIQAPFEDSGLPDESFDLVTSYIVLHEIPVAATHTMFAEAFRLLRPGGQCLMTDIRPHRDRDDLDVWQQEFNAVNGGEPFWREAAQLNLADVAAEHGFVDAKSYGLGELHYPWVTIATKPEQ
jgi:ubiquinone/menaquinone biosynthesis C-methylase UbiE